MVLRYFQNVFLQNICGSSSLSWANPSELIFMCGVRWGGRVGCFSFVLWIFSYFISIYKTADLVLISPLLGVSLPLWVNHPTDLDLSRLQRGGKAMHTPRFSGFLGCSPVVLYSVVLYYRMCVPGLVSIKAEIQTSETRELKCRSQLLWQIFYHSRKVVHQHQSSESAHPLHTVGEWWFEKEG